MEEILRFDPSVPVWRRVTTGPVTLGGVELPQGAKLFLWLAATGRDPLMFPDPDGFDLGRRGADKHLAFGLGLHYCLGASLGKLEARLALEELTARYPRLRLADDQRLSFHPTSPSAARRRCGSAAPERPATVELAAIQLVALCRDEHLSRWETLATVPLRLSAPPARNPSDGHAQACQDLTLRPGWDGDHSSSSARGNSAFFPR